MWICPNLNIKKVHLPREGWWSRYCMQHPYSQTFLSPASNNYRLGIVVWYPAVHEERSKQALTKQHHLPKLWTKNPHLTWKATTSVHGRQSMMLCVPRMLTCIMNSRSFIRATTIKKCHWWVLQARSSYSYQTLLVSELSSKTVSPLIIFINSFTVEAYWDVLRRLGTEPELNHVQSLTFCPGQKLAWTQF